MSKFKKFKDQTLARAYTKLPSLLDLYVRRADLVVNTTSPYTPLAKPLDRCRLAMVTTAGLHTREQEPFDMADKNGDPSCREIPADVDMGELTITHNYFNTVDAMADPNLVLPIEPLRDLVRQGVIGSIGPRFFSFMGHILAEHLKTLTQNSTPQIAAALKADAVDAVFLTPA
jgi:D-proline reductase (dithiol) PrdB